MSEERPQIKMMRLASILLEATQQGRVEWSVANDNSTSFITERRAGSVSISSVDEDGVAPFALTAYDSTGTRVDTLSTGFTRSGDTDDGLSPHEWNELLRNLYESARRKALKIDAVVDDLIQDFELPF